ncbi:MAG: hypothetical protein MUE60_05010 [Candidatus Eisenbacteria bacterium]|jgi:hypothetical protein|nr:hypothetical protein [Candidatus Eisenbacteria bacterium]
MSIDTFMEYPGLRDEGRAAEDQFRRWLTSIEQTGHLGQLEEVVAAWSSNDDLTWVLDWPIPRDRRLVPGVRRIGPLRPA